MYIQNKEELKQIIKNWRNNKEINKYDYFNIVKGNIPIIISCPHARSHVQNGKKQQRDFYTGTIGKVVSNITGAHLIYITKELDFDPNYDPDTLYIRELIKYIKENNIKFLIDLHGMQRNHQKNVEIGTNSGYNVICDFNLINEIKTTIEATIPDVVVDEYFKAGKRTISSRIRKNTNILTIQLELNRKYRAMKKRPKSFVKMNNCLIELVFFINKYIDG